MGVGIQILYHLKITKKRMKKVKKRMKTLDRFMELKEGEGAEE